MAKQRSEPETTELHGKKVRVRSQRKKRESLRQPREFPSPGTEVRK